MQNMEKIEIRNLLVKAKQAGKDIDKDWLKGAKEVAIKRRKKQFEKLPSFPLDQLEGIASDEDPVVFLVEPLDDAPRSVEIQGREKPAKVIDILVHRSSEPDVVKEGQKYSLWYTTVLETEMKVLPRPLEGTRFLLCYYGRFQKGKKPKSTDPHIFRAVPQD